MQDLSFYQATSADAQEILRLYRSLVGTEGCAWDETYPSTETIAEDLQRGALFCLRGADGIAAVASYGDFAELNDLPWRSPLRAPCELARIGVWPARQHAGLATRILRCCIDAARAAGFDGMRLLVARCNPAAQRLYAANGFENCGVVRMYDNDYFYEQLTFTER